MIKDNLKLIENEVTKALHYFYLHLLMIFRTIFQKYKNIC